jgi:hypothetical protein
MAASDLLLIILIGIVTSAGHLRAQSGPCAPAPTNAAAWWPGDDHSYDVVGERFALLQNGAGYARGLVGSAFRFDGAQERVRILEATNTDLSRLPRWTVEAWVRPASFVNSANPTVYSEGNRIASIGVNNGTGKLESWVNNDSSRRLIGTNALTLDGWNHVALVFEGTRRLLYLNGVLDGSTNTPPINDDSSGAAIGQVTINDNTAAFAGDIDEVTVYHRALTAPEIAALADHAAGKCFGDAPCPHFALHPESATAFLGETVALNGIAMATPRPTYQWYFKDLPLPGETNSALVIPDMDANKGGPYKVVARNDLCAATSQVAVVTVPWCSDPPATAIAWWPGDGNALDALGSHDGAIWGGTTFGPGKVGRAFFFNGTNAYAAIPDALEFSPHLGTTGQLSIEAWVKLDEFPQPDSVSGENRRCVISKGAPGQWEFALQVDTTGVPSFVLWNLNGSNYARVTGGQILTSQWHHIVATLEKGTLARLYQDGFIVGSSTNFNGDTGEGRSPIYLGRRGDAQFLKGWVDEVAFYRQALSGEEVAGLYATDASGRCSGAPSPAPHFVRQPENQSGYLLLGAGLSTFAIGTPRPTYQWFRSNATEWVALPGMTNATLTWPTINENAEGNYRALATNPHGAATSASAYLKVIRHDILTGGEQFEKGWNGWTIDNGTIWEVGSPTSGPGSAFAGNGLVATLLEGNYPEDRSSRLISPPFEVPTAEQMPRLRFWQWWSIGAHDWAQVQIKTGSNDWRALSGQIVLDSSSHWSRGWVDLTAYSGQTVQLGFYLESHSAYDVFGRYISSVGAGWYLDDVRVETGPVPAYERVETFEQGWGGWRVDYIGGQATDFGIWQIGVPTTGPGAALEGSQCAATLLSGNYPEDRSGRLFSPTFVVPAAEALPPQILALVRPGRPRFLRAANQSRNQCLAALASLHCQWQRSLEPAGCRFVALRRTPGADRFLFRIPQCLRRVWPIRLLCRTRLVYR